MISGSGLISWMRFPTVVYMAATSVLSRSPRSGCEQRQPTRARLGSFMMSIPATRGFAGYRAADVLPGRDELRGRPAVVEPEAVIVGLRAAPAGVEHVAVGYDDEARAGERLDAGVVDLYRGRPGKIRVGGQVLIGDRRGLLGHPHAEREPHAVEAVPGDRLGQLAAVDAVQAGRQAEVLVEAVPVHPGQPDPASVRVDDETPARR